MSGFSTPPEDQPSPDAGAFVPGGNARAEWYDTPEGSQAIAPEDEQTAPSADSNEVLYLNPSDPNYAFSNSPLTPSDPNYVQLSGTDFDEHDGYITIPVETD